VSRTSQVIFRLYTALLRVLWKGVLSSRSMWTI